MFMFNNTYGSRICYAPDDETGADTGVDTNVDTGTQEVDTGIDTSAKGIEEGSDLDKKLDELAGITSNVAKAPKTDPKAKATDGTTTTPAAKKPGEEGYVPPRQEQRNDRTNEPRTYQPRAYPKAYKSDVQGNVILANTGEIIATAGAGRKAFERMLPLIATATTEAEKYKGLYESASQANVIAANLKLSPEEYSIGARVMAAFKADPKKAIAFMIQEAQNNGVDMSDLGMSGGGLSLKAIEDALQARIDKALEKFNFIAEDRETQLQERERTEESTRVIDEFMTNYPDAEVHADAIARIMNTRPGEIDIEKAYYILKTHATTNGLDWTKPLAPQIEAKLGTTTTKQPANNGRKLPDFGGRPNNENIVERRPQVMSGEASTSDIVKEAMREAGMNVS